MLLRAATPDDVPIVLSFIRQLAAYEKLSHEVEATEETLRATLFPVGGRTVAECILAFEGGAPAGFALYFLTYSTFLAKPGLYLEDLFVVPERRGRGIGKALILHLARLASDRGYGRMEWAVLDWNEPSIGFYKKLGAATLDDWTTMRLTGDALLRLGEKSGIGN